MTTSFQWRGLEDEKTEQRGLPLGKYQQPQVTTGRLFESTPGTMSDGSLSKMKMNQNKDDEKLSSDSSYVFLTTRAAETLLQKICGARTPRRIFTRSIAEDPQKN